jgi:hypothetical protein
MRKYYICIGILILFCTVLVGVLFSLVGSPWTIQAKQLDTQRLTDFYLIQSAVEGYYRDNKRLPETLGETKQYNESENLTDPETHKQYNYKTQSEYSYELCTSFSTVASSVNSSQNVMNPYINSVNLKHTKGYNCLSYTIPSYLITSSVYPSNVTLSPTSTIGPVPTTTTGTTNTNIINQADYTKFKSESAIIAPTQGEVLCLGKQYAIKWRVPADDIQGITLQIAQPTNGDTIHTIGSFPGTYISNKPGYGSYTWIVGNTIDTTTFIPSPAYHIILSGDYHGWDVTTDSQLFTIDNCTKNN